MDTLLHITHIIHAHINLFYPPLLFPLKRSPRSEESKRPTAPKRGVDDECSQVPSARRQARDVDEEYSHIPSARRQARDGDDGCSQVTQRRLIILMRNSSPPGREGP